MKTKRNSTVVLFIDVQKHIPTVFKMKTKRRLTKITSVNLHNVTNTNGFQDENQTGELSNVSTHSKQLECLRKSKSLLNVVPTVTCGQRI
jgi:hypothetical protein